MKRLLEFLKKKKHLNTTTLNAKRSGFGEMVSWLIRVVIYDICITTISDVFGVPRLVALLIFLAILAAIAFGGYVLKQKMAPGVDDKS